MKDKVISILDKFAVAWHPTGSRYICNPAPFDTDMDIVCLGTDELRMALDLAGATIDGNPEQYEGMHDFMSMRLGFVNVIITEKPSFYKKFVEATEMAKEKNLLKKSDRISLFQEHLYGADEIPY